MSSNYGETGSGAQPVAGWYNDPQGTAGERYWDGSTWTDQTRAPGGASDPYAGGVAAPVYAGQQPASTTQPYGQGGAQFDANGKQVTTADGVPLAGWGRRFGGWLLDSIIWFVIASVIAAVVAGDAFARYMNLVTASNGQVDPSDPVVLQTVTELGTRWALGLGIAGVLLFLYLLLLWRFTGARVGDMIAGVRAVPVDQGQVKGLSWRAAALRALAFAGVWLAYLIPVGGGLLALIVSLVVVISCLVAVSDAKKQGWIDKGARTQVVRTR